MRLFSFLYFLFLVISAYSQDFMADMDMATQANFDYRIPSHYTGNGNSAAILDEKSNSALVKYNPLVWIGKGLLWAYQNIVSPQIQADCAYELTCSNFSKHAISEYGLLKGIALSADRLTRCNTLAVRENSTYRYNPITGNYSDKVEYYQTGSH